MLAKGFTEQALVEQLQQGSVTAYDALYNLYFDAVYANICKLVRDEAAAEDIMQEVFIRLWEKRGTLRPGHSVGNWLFVVSYNRSLNYLRGRLRERLGLQHLPPQALLGGDLEELLLTEQQLYMMEKAIAQLPPQRRKVFQLCRMQGKTYAQAAHELQISRYTVKEHIAKASDFIREYIRLQPGHQALFISIAALAHFVA